MKKVIILGGSGAGLIAASIVERNNEMQLLGFLNNDFNEGDYIRSYSKKIPVLGKMNEVNKFIEEDDVFAFVAFEGIRDPYKSYEYLKSLKIPTNKLINIIDKMSVVPEGYCELGKGILVAPFSQMSPGAHVSDHCLMLGNSFLGHDSYLEEFVKLTTNSVVGADVRIGLGTTVGTNSVIRERVSIGKFCLIGSGSVVVKDVPDNTVVVGNPAHFHSLRGHLSYLEGSVNKNEKG